MYDLVIIGGGPGGYVAAIRSAQNGLKTALIEKERVGGTCLNRGCIPTKALLAGSQLVFSVARGSLLGLKVEDVSLDWQGLQAHKRDVVDRLVHGVETLLARHGVEVLRGLGRLLGPGRVAVNNVDGEIVLEASRAVVLATGSEPLLPDFLGYDGRTVVSSTEALEFDTIPESLLIVGGGVVGCEFASLFSTLHCKVTIVEVLPNVLPLLDRETARRVQVLLRRQGIEIKTKTRLQKLAVRNGRAVATLESGEEISAEKALVAIGRRLNTEGLAEVGVALGAKNEVLVDEFLRTNIPGVYAIGDITNKIQLAHVASAQGLAVAAHLTGQPRNINYGAIPNCVYTSPEVASVGLTEEEVREQGLDYRSGVFPFSVNGKAMTMEETDGVVKVLAEAGSGCLLGVHVVGPQASNLVAEAALAVQQGLTVEHVAETIHAHPSLAEAFAEACEAVRGRSIHI